MMERQGITEELKVRDQMEWVRAVNNIRNAAEEIVLKELVYIESVERGCEKRIVPKKERPRVYNELKVFLSVIINLQ